jgi:hypothetical protein
MVDANDAKPLTDLIRDYYTEHKANQALSIRELYFGEGYSGIKSWAIAPYENIPPAQGVIALENRGSSTIDQIVIDRYALHHSHGLVLPLLHIHKLEKHDRRWMIWFTKDGKATPKNWPEIKKRVDVGYDVITFDFRGLGETQMRYKAVSEDDPSLALLNDEQAYVNPLSSVLADYVYNSLLTGRPYFLQMIEDAEIALRFSREVLHAETFSIASDPQSTVLANAIAGSLPGVGVIPHPDMDLMKWSDLVVQEREQWPIEYLLPGGAYIQ